MQCFLIVGWNGVMERDEGMVVQFFHYFLCVEENICTYSLLYPYFKKTPLRMGAIEINLFYDSLPVFCVIVCFIIIIIIWKNKKKFQLRESCQL